MDTLNRLVLHIRRNCDGNKCALVLLNLHFERNLFEFRAQENVLIVDKL